MSGNRIIFVTTIPATLRAFLLPYVRMLRNHGWCVHGAARELSAHAELRNEFDAVWDINWTRNPFQLANVMQAARRIREVILAQGYDIVHVHTPVASFVTRYSMRNVKWSSRPVMIYTAHGFHFHEGGRGFANRLYLSLEKIAGRWTDYLVTINDEDHRAVLRHGIVPEHSLRLMPGIGIDTDHYSPHCVSWHEIEFVRKELGLVEDTPLFLMIAGFDPGKRHCDAVRALGRMRNKNAHLAFAGKGRLFESVKQLVTKLGLTHRVHFLGYRNDVRPLIRASVATLLPSEREGLSRSVMESMALQTPVIGANARGVRDLLASGGGILVGVGDVDALARSMDWIVEHPVEARAMGEQGRHIVTANYDIQRLLSLHQQLYAEALKTRQLGGGKSNGASSKIAVDW